jgi:predicted HTH domain antitoxin
MTIEVMVPDDVFAILGKSPAEIARDLRLAAAVEWYAEGLVSQGRASELAGVSRVEFFDELARRKVPVIQMTVEDLRGRLKSHNASRRPVISRIIASQIIVSPVDV